MFKEHQHGRLWRQVRTLYSDASEHDSLGRFVDLIHNGGSILAR